MTAGGYPGWTYGDHCECCGHIFTQIVDARSVIRRYCDDCMEGFNRQRLARIEDVILPMDFHWLKEGF